MKTDQMQARARHQCCQPLHEFQRRHHEVARAVAIGGLQLEHRLPRAVHTEPLVGDGRARDVAAQVLKRLAFIGGAAHPRMQAESVGVGAQGLGDRRGAQRIASSALCAPPAARARCGKCRRRLAGVRAGCVRINDPVRIRPIGHALFFDQMPLAGQQPQDARDDLAEQRRELLTR